MKGDVWPQTVSGAPGSTGGALSNTVLWGKEKQSWQTRGTCLLSPHFPARTRDEVQSAENFIELVLAQVEIETCFILHNQTSSI